MTTLNTNVPQAAITSTGILLPDEADILAGSLADLKQALGNTMSEDLRSPQGQIATTNAAIIAAKNDELATFMNMVDPAQSVGRWQDAIGNIYFLERKPASGTAVTCRLEGLVKTIIPAGTLAQDTAGYTYISTGDAEIDASGFAEAIFQNTTPGPIPCPVGTLTNIIVGIGGWSSIINNTPGVLGSTVESTIAFEDRRSQSVTINAVNTNSAVKANILAIDDVIDAYVIDNYTSVAKIVGATNFSVKPHSIYVCVYGGADKDIAEAIFRKKPPGCDMNGNTTYIVYDTNYPSPQPQYNITWQEAIPTPIKFDIEIANSINLPSNIISLVRQAVLDSFSGADGTLRAGIGATIYSGKYNSVIFNIDKNLVAVNHVRLSFDGITWSTSLPIGIDQIPTLSTFDINVTLV